MKICVQHLDFGQGFNQRQIKPKHKAALMVLQTLLPLILMSHIFVQIVKTCRMAWMYEQIYPLNFYF